MTVNGQALWVITDAITRSLSHPKPPVAKINLSIPLVSTCLRGQLTAVYKWTISEEEGADVQSRGPSSPPATLMTLSVALKRGAVTRGSGDVTSRGLYDGL